MARESACSRCNMLQHVSAASGRIKLPGPPLGCRAGQGQEHEAHSGGKRERPRRRQAAAGAARRAAGHRAGKWSDLRMQGEAKRIGRSGE